MGQGATLLRINKQLFEKIKINKKIPTSFEEEIYVDKLWEPIMYILGKGYLGREPIVNLFMPIDIIITHEDENMTEGIRYHDKSKAKELYDYICNISVEELLSKVEVEKINNSVMYSIEKSDLNDIKNHINAIKQCLQSTIENDDVILALLG